MLQPDPSLCLNEAEPRQLRSWWRVLLLNLALYFVGIGILILTKNPIIFPTVVMLGSFMFPISYVAFFYERRHLSCLTMPTTTMSLLYGGGLGVFAAALLEPLFISRLTFTTAFAVGLIEEWAKVFGVIALARRRLHDSELDGLILGVATGMGFAAFESTGYAFAAFLHTGGDLSLTVGIVLMRGVISPLGHGTWTAILCSVLFRERRAGRFRFNHRVLGAYLLVVVLHGLWNGLPGTLGDFSFLLAFLGQMAIGGFSFIILRQKWKQAKLVQISRMTPLPPPEERNGTGEGKGTP